MAPVVRKQQEHTYHGFAEKRDAVIRFLTHKASIDEIQRQYKLQRYQFQAWVGQVLDRDRTVIALVAKAYQTPKEIAAHEGAPVQVKAPKELEAQDFVQTMPDLVRELGVQALKDLLEEGKRSKAKKRAS